MEPLTDDWAAQRRVDAITARRAALAPHLRQHLERQEREQEARRTAKEYRKAQRAIGLQTCNKCNDTQPLTNFPLMPSGNPHASCKSCRGALSREANRRRSLGLAPRRKCRPADVSADLERLRYLASALAGTNSAERITSEQRWNNVASALEKLWVQSGDKECVSCKQSVPPTKMLPPGPANFYPGKCQPCAHKEACEHSRRVTGRDPEGPRLIPMRDGTAITIGELARRHRERMQGRR